MENDPRSHPKRLCSCDLVWFGGSFFCKPQEHRKRNSDTTDIAELLVGGV
jgi:hypothetical protein